MALTKLELIGELKHEINSPLAAIRNALYLAGTRSDDPELQRYLRLADDEVCTYLGNSQKRKSNR